MFVIKKTNKAFSIVEVIIALSVISLAFLGILSLSLQNIKVQNVNKYQLTASMLAQEGIELVRNVRDENWLMGNDFGNSITDTDGTFTIDYGNNIDDTPNNIGDAGAVLHINGDGYYDHNNTGTKTMFSRLISVTDNGDYIFVKSTIAWTINNKTYQYTAETNLYDWK